MMPSNECDYSLSDFTIQQAMVDHVKRLSDKRRRPLHIQWGNRRVQTSDVREASSRGILRAEFTSGISDVLQIDGVKTAGWFEWEKGEKVLLLRTLKDDRFEEIVEYQFFLARMGVFTFGISTRGRIRTARRSLGSGLRTLDFGLRPSASTNILTIARLSRQIHLTSLRSYSRFRLEPC